ncbi:MAG TPA: 4-alpha-glucanotransferase [bacterium]|nr:4-alpha-glucanotransferase [bacterium]
MYNIFQMEAHEKNIGRAGDERRSGVLAPLFSIYSTDSRGIGDFEDLRLLVDWCKKTGNSIIQLLPLNEVGSNFCPYESISSFALEPVYAAVGRGENTRKPLPATEVKRVNYGIKKEKIKLLREMHAREGRKLSGYTEEFRSKNSWWIEDFALFKALKKRFEGKPWYEWHEKYRELDSRSLRTFSEENREETEFQVWLQSFLYRQFCTTSEYAKEKGVLLMGDMPIVINRDSADVWAHREFFNMELAAGAPPDVFSVKGQRWGNPGMPTYNWEKIEKDGYRYLRERLGYAGEFYDILRIDHIVGLFRLWSVPFREPLSNEGLNGFFDPPDEKSWKEHGMKILSAMLESTGMILCGEDLGIIPAACPQTMEELGIPGIDVQRWKKDWNGTQDFLPPGEYRRLSVSALSTHDTSNWNHWWENETSQEEKEKFRRHLQTDGNLEGNSLLEANRAAMRFILKTRSLFSIQLIFDWLNLFDGILKGDQSKIRINTPGTVSLENWSAVLPVTIEDLMDDSICSVMRKLVEDAGR